jgi:protein SCO1/2
VVTKTTNGKQYTDTVWHKVPEINVTNHLGQKVDWGTIKDKVIVADFFFTHCPTICPPMTRNMKALQDGIKSNAKVGNRDAEFVQFLSFSIDPERDSVQQLKKWADRFQVNPQNWWLLTGNRQEIYDFSINDLKLLAQDGETIDSNFLHTDYFVLIDRNRHIRGYYHGLDTASMKKLSEDLIVLSLEKDPNRKSFLSGKLELLGIIFVIAALCIVVLMRFLKKEKR